MFFAATPDQTTFDEPDLARLLALVKDVCDCDEDVAVWHGNHVVCVVHRGHVVWLRPEYKPAAFPAA
jgi:hypothetical protein